MLSLICVMLAAICNAAMDTMVHHYSTSIFNRPGKFWADPAISWKYKYIDWDNNQKQRRKTIFGLNYPVQLTDAWHFFKMLMLIFIMLAIVLYVPLMEITQNIWIDRLIDFSVFGGMWCLYFSSFYKIFRK